jgi:hypothetical protein
MAAMMHELKFCRRRSRPESQDSGMWAAREDWTHMHCTENSKQIFPEMKLRGLVPNFLLSFILFAVWIHIFQLVSTWVKKAGPVCSYGVWKVATFSRIRLPMNFYRNSEINWLGAYYKQWQGQVEALTLGKQCPNNMHSTGPCKSVRAPRQRTSDLVWVRHLV